MNWQFVGQAYLIGASSVAVVLFAFAVWGTIETLRNWRYYNAPHRRGVAEELYELWVGAAVWIFLWPLLLIMIGFVISISIPFTRKRARHR